MEGCWDFGKEREEWIREGRLEAFEDSGRSSGEGEGGG